GQLGEDAEQRPTLPVQCVVDVVLPGHRDLRHRARVQPVRRRGRRRAQSAQHEVAMADAIRSEATPPSAAPSAVQGKVPLLKTEGLRVVYRSRGGVMVAVQDASIEVREGESVALVGESGSGKSTVA